VSFSFRTECRSYLWYTYLTYVRKKKIVTMEVTSEEVHDGKVLKKLIDNASKNNNVKSVHSFFLVFLLKQKSG
jgi:hypothetical protein